MQETSGSGDRTNKWLMDSELVDKGKIKKTSYFDCIGILISSKFKSFYTITQSCEISKACDDHKK